MTDLIKLRKKIDELDQKLLNLLKRRVELSNQIKSLKKEKNIPLKDKSREKEIMRTLIKTKKLNSKLIKAIYLSIFKYGK